MSDDDQSGRDEPGDEREDDIRRLCDAADYGAAATRAIAAYGPEISRFIGGRARSAADAEDVFALFCADLWSGLRGFGWRCSLRGWAYTLARHAELRHAGAPARRHDRLAAAAADALALRARTTTAPYRRTAVKDRFRRIRARLSEEDQLILILRVDRGLGWRDIAWALTPRDERAEAALRREECRVRKRFQIIKERLQRWAIEDGLLPARRNG